MLRIRAKLCPELLDAYRQRGEIMHLRYLIQVCPLPHEAQADAYNLLVTGRQGGRPQGSRSGESHKKGQFAEPKHLRRWLKDVREKSSSASSLYQGARQSAWLEGVRFALECAAGKRNFTLLLDDE